MNQIAALAQAHGNATITKKDHVVVGSILWNADTKERTYEWTKVRTMIELRNLLGY